MSPSLIILITSIVCMLGLLAIAWWLWRLPVDGQHLAEPQIPATPPRQQPATRPAPAPAQAPVPAPPAAPAPSPSPPPPPAPPANTDDERTTMYMRAPPLGENSGTQILVDPSSPVSPKRSTPPPPPPPRR